MINQIIKIKILNHCAAEDLTKPICNKVINKENIDNNFSDIEIQKASDIESQKANASVSSEEKSQNKKKKNKKYKKLIVLSLLFLVLGALTGLTIYTPGNNTFNVLCKNENTEFKYNIGSIIEISQEGKILNNTKINVRDTINLCPENEKVQQSVQKYCDIYISSNNIILENQMPKNGGQNDI